VRATFDGRYKFARYCSPVQRHQPTTLDQLMAVSDAGHVMPPKSTWFEPKLRSGLFVHELS